MDFRILGPLEVIENGHALDLGGQKQRMLLAALLIEANRVVSSDRLVDALWPERPPETAAKALQVYVSQLRKTLGKARVETKPPGYLLRVEDGELDLERSRRLIEEGRPAEALSLWRGPSLCDFAYEPFAQAEIGRLEELRLAWLEERIERNLGEGRHADLVGELEVLVREHPLREPLRAQLMLALYRAGRQAEALEVYQAGRLILAEELGLEPGEALKRLQKQILAHAPELDLPVDTAPGPPEMGPESRPGEASTRTVGARETRKIVTVLVAALGTGGGEPLDPEAQRRLSSRAFAEIGDVVERHGGTIETFAGDTVTAVFGVPVVHEDDAVRAVRAACELLHELKVVSEEFSDSWRAVLDVRVGVSTGEVVTGGDTSQHRSTGTPITSAVRLGQAAEPMEVLLDERTHLLLRDAVEVERVGVALRLLALRTDVLTHPSRFNSPMVGRERERRRLADAFEQAVGDRSCQLFTILGAAGVGKSRLVQEFLDGLDVDARVVRGRCLPYGQGITYFPLMEAVRDAAGLEDTESPEESLRKIESALGGENDADGLARRIGELVGLADVGVGVEGSFAAVRVLLESLAARTPLVVVFDDIHWGEETFLDLVEYLADWTTEAPVLIVAIARPELLDVRPGWGGGKLNATSVLLEPLSDEESAELVDNLVGLDPVGEQVRHRIVGAAGGNPLFVEEMLALVLENPGTEADVEIPPTIQALLAARLDRLEDGERAVVEHAAVQGKVFYHAALEELAPERLRPEVAATLRSLVRKGLIRPDRPGLGGRTYRFRHLLIRDAASESIPKEARAGIHERFGRWLDRAAGDRAGEYEEIVGYHLEQAHRYRTELGPPDDAARALAREAAERLGRAGRRAFVHSDAPAGINLISRAVALLPADDRLRVELVPNVRVVQGLGGDMRWAERVLTEAVEAAATSGDRALAAHALVQRGLLRLFTAPDVTSAELFDVAHRAIAVFEELDDELGLARAWRLVAQAHYLDRRGACCAEASERALVHARRARDRFEEHEIVEWLVVTLFLGPASVAEAATRCLQLLDESGGDRALQVQILGALAFLTAIQGEEEQARQFIERGRRMADELGEWIWLFSFHVAYVSVSAGDPAAAEAELRPSYEALKKLGEKSHFSTMAHYLAVAVYAQGRYEEAEQLARECEEASRPNDVHSRIMGRSIRAKVLARRREFREAISTAREAIAIADDSDFLLARAESLMDMGEVLQLAGKPVEAAAAIRDAVALYEQKGSLVSAAQARARLEGV